MSASILDAMLTKLMSLWSSCEGDAFLLKVGRFTDSFVNEATAHTVIFGHKPRFMTSWRKVAIAKCTVLGLVSSECIL